MKDLKKYTTPEIFVTYFDKIDVIQASTPGPQPEPWPPSLDDSDGSNSYLS
ncbi:MAG: hypothetical protein Q4E88_05580 [Coriobacteriia bacterium]|nr:hypothetical protein [Coriobacteriia bacterium]